MYQLHGHSINDLYPQLCKDVLKAQEVRPRGLITHEITPALITLLDPKFNVLASVARKPNYGFMAAELLWILNGRDDVGMLAFYNKRMIEFSDDKSTLAGAYGPRIMSQFFYIYETLRQDPASRQAIITIWQPKPAKSADIPCTVMMHFLIRNGKLNLHVYMRSNDLWLGFPYDVHNFTCIQMIMASLLKVEVGVYHHFVGSLHLYQEHFQKAEQVVEEVKFQPDEFSPDIAWTHWYGMHSELDSVQRLETQIRHIGEAGTTLESVQDEVYLYPHRFWAQKLSWMFNKAKGKYEPKNS